MLELFSLVLFLIIYKFFIIIFGKNKKGIYSLTKSGINKFINNFFCIPVRI